MDADLQHCYGILSVPRNPLDEFMLSRDRKSKAKAADSRGQRLPGSSTDLSLPRRPALRRGAGQRGRSPTSLFTGHSTGKPVGRACARRALCARLQQPACLCLALGAEAGPRAGPDWSVRIGRPQRDGRDWGGASGNNTRSCGPGYLLLRRLTRVMFLVPNLSAAAAATAATP